LSQFLKKDFEIISHSRKKITDIDFRQNIKNFVNGDITNHQTLNKIIKLKPDIIIYTISLNHFDSEYSLINSVKVSVSPFLHLLENIKEKKLNTEIVYFSTMQVYGRNYNKRIINETYPKKLHNIYALTHSICEDALISYGQNIKFSILRLSNAFGFPVFPNTNVWWPVLNNICKMAKKNFHIKLQSDGSPLRDFISLDNIGLFMKKLIMQKNKNNEIINLCSGKTLSILNVAQKVATCAYFKKPIPINKKKSLKIKNYLFKYDNSRMKSYLPKLNLNLEKDIYKFLSKI
jgi:UDP-glucose 4-epimerase